MINMVGKPQKHGMMDVFTAIILLQLDLGGRILIREKVTGIVKLQILLAFLKLLQLFMVLGIDATDFSFLVGGVHCHGVCILCERCALWLRFVLSVGNMAGKQVKLDFPPITHHAHHLLTVSPTST